MNCVKSDWIELKQGVPQNTPLGPLLFNLYVNDLTGQIMEDARIIQYADDCLLLVVTRTLTLLCNVCKQIF